MLAKFMAIPHHTYLIMKMLAPNGILSVLGDTMVSYNCESATVELSKDSAIKAATTVMVAQAAKIDQTTLEVPEQKRTSTALDPSPAVKKVCLGLPDASKEVVIGANLDPNRNSRSPISSGTTLTSSHGARLTCPVSPGSWPSTHLKSTRLHDLSSKSSNDLQKIKTSHKSRSL
jgi:hypothetical protein